MTKTFETGTAINRVDVTGVIPPVPGNTVAYDVSIPDDANCTLVSVDWFLTSQEYLPPGTVFEAGKDYMIGVEVAPKDGYEFPETVPETIIDSAPAEEPSDWLPHALTEEEIERNRASARGYLHLAEKCRKGCV